MLKKFFSTVLVTVATVLMAQSAFAYYNPFDSLSANAINGYKSLYYSIPNYGVEYDGQNSGIRGIKFQDLDNDNVPEMIVDYFVYDPIYDVREGFYYLRIYTIENDAPLLIYDNVETKGVADYASNSFELTYGNDGNTYVVNKFALGSGGILRNYELLYKEGNAIKRKALFHSLGNTDMLEFTIDNNKVNSAAFNSEIQKYMNSVNQYHLQKYDGTEIGYLTEYSGRVSFGFISAADINYMMNAALMKKVNS